jgi:hypothetical protein
MPKRPAPYELELNHPKKQCLLFPKKRRGQRIGERLCAEWQRRARDWRAKESFLWKARRILGYGVSPSLTAVDDDTAKAFQRETENSTVSKGDKTRDDRTAKLSGAPSQRQLRKVQKAQARLHLSRFTHEDTMRAARVSERDLKRYLENTKASSQRDEGKRLVFDLTDDDTPSGYISVHHKGKIKRIRLSKDHVILIREEAQGRDKPSWVRERHNELVNTNTTSTRIEDSARSAPSATEPPEKQRRISSTPITLSKVSSMIDGLDTPAPRIALSPNTPTPSSTSPKPKSRDALPVLKHSPIGPTVPTDQLCHQLRRDFSTLPPDHRHYGKALLWLRSLRYRKEEVLRTYTQKLYSKGMNTTQVVADENVKFLNALLSAVTFEIYVCLSSHDPWPIPWTDGKRRVGKDPKMPRIAARDLLDQADIRYIT